MLAACSLSPAVTRSAVDYNEVSATVMQKMLVLNILRAGEGAPLAFSDLSLIRGSLSGTVGGQVSWPFGPFDKDMMRTNSIQLGPLSLQSSPSFDSIPLNTREFSEGLLESVSQNLMFYYLDRGYAPGVLFPLMVGGLAYADVRAWNGALVEQPTSISALAMIHLFKAWSDECELEDKAGSCPRLVNVPETTSVFDGLPLKILSSPTILSQLASLKAAGWKLSRTDRKTLAVGSEKPSVYLCVRNPMTEDDDLILFRSSSTTGGPAQPLLPRKQVCGAHGSKRVWFASLRSPQEMFVILGQLALEDSEDVPRRDPETVIDALDDPRAVRDEMRGLMKFFIRRARPASPSFSVDYRGDAYYVSNFRRAVWNECVCGDYTVAILGVLEDVLNLHRNANEIQSTPAAQIVSSPAR